MAYPQVQFENQPQQVGPFAQILRAAGAFMGKDRLQREDPTQPDVPPRYKEGFWDTLYGGRAKLANQAADVDAYNRAARLADLPAEYKAQFENIVSPTENLRADIASRHIKETGSEHRKNIGATGENEIKLANLNNDARMNLERLAQQGRLAVVNQEGQNRLAVVDAQGQVQRTLSADEAAYTNQRLDKQIRSQQDLQRDAHLNRLVEMSHSTDEAVRHEAQSQLGEWERANQALQGGMGDFAELSVQNALRGTPRALTYGQTLFDNLGSTAITPKGTVEQRVNLLPSQMRARASLMQNAAPAPTTAPRQGLPGTTSVPAATTSPAPTVPRTPALGAFDGSRGQAGMENLNQMVDKTVKGIYNPLAERVSQSAFVGSPLYNMFKSTAQ